jgi:hypothetical protein
MSAELNPEESVLSADEVNTRLHLISGRLDGFDCNIITASALLVIGVKILVFIGMPRHEIDDLFRSLAGEVHLKGQRTGLDS